MVRGRLVVPLALLCACGASSHSTSGGGRGTGGMSGSGAATADAGTGGEAGGAAFNLTLEVRENAPEYLPAVGVSVRVEGGGTVVEVRTDRRGHAVAAVDPASGPWDVTVARAEFVPISVIGVSASLERPLVLVPIVSTPYALRDPSWPTVQLDGRIRGRTSDTSILTFESPNLLVYSSEGDRYGARIAAAPDTKSVRLLVTERGSDDLLDDITNATWLDVDWTNQDVTADLAFPTPARAAVRRSVSVELPTTGAVRGEGLSAEPRLLYRNESHFSEHVGRTSAASDPDHGGRYTWDIAALDGDMAPSHVGIVLGDASLGTASDDRSVVLHAPVDGSDSLRLPPAERLEAAGETLTALSLTWSASAYTNVGASLHRVDAEPGRWYLYSAGPVREEETRGWPHLPSDVKPSDVGLGDDTLLHTYVFAADLPNGGSPWDWQGDPEMQGLVRGYGQPIVYPDTGTGGSGGSGGAGDSGAGGVSTAEGGAGGEAGATTIEPRPPLEEGIYSLDDVLLNQTACDVDGPSVLADYAERYFFIELVDDFPSAASCADVDDCSAKASAALDAGDISDINASWDFHLVVVGGSAWGTAHPGTADSDGVCRNAWEEETFASPQPAHRVRLELASFTKAPYPAHPSLECHDIQAFANARAITCTSQRVFVGTLVASL